LDNIAQQSRLPVTPPPLNLTQEETAIISLIRGNAYQEISVQIQDSVITSVNQTLKFRRKKGGGFVFFGLVAAKTNLTPEEIEIIKLLREKPFQQVTILIKNSKIEGFNQTTKFRKKI